jgi:processive 1,2-diacylglycerol beta-glucosyltransferase
MTPKRVILMYISEVSGHHSATIAIEKAIKEMAPATEILNINAFNYTNPISEKIVNRLYMSVIKRTPKIWDYLYDNPVVVKKLEHIKKRVHQFNSPKLKRLFDKFKPDVVACSQAFPCGMVADYKATYGSKLPLVAVLTDFVPHAYWIYDTVDAYIAPSHEMAERLVQRGVPAHKIKTYGIPFNHSFNAPVDRVKSMEKLGLDPSQPTVLVMGGGQGLGPIKTVVKSLESSRYAQQIIVVTGTNKKLYKSLKKKARKYAKKTLVYGYAHNVNELMTAADLIISKPGGITTAEAMSKHLPMAVLKPIPGQEMNNTAFLMQKGAAVNLDVPRETGAIIDGILGYPHTLSRMKEAAAHISKPHASMDIAKLLLHLAHG